MNKKVGLFEAPEIGGGGLLFTLEDVVYSPETPTMDEPFTVTGKIKLFGLPFLAPAWVVAYVIYPETWWEEIIPIWGSPRVSEGDFALGGNFEIAFPKGFQREGDFDLSVEVHAGPTMPIDSFTIPPFPPLAKEEMSFTVAGKPPPEEERIQEFRIVSYAKNGGTPMTPPNVLELEIGDKCRVKVGGIHKGPAIGGTLHVALWNPGPLWNRVDEVAAINKANSIPVSTDWEPFEATVDIAITSAVKAGAEYSIYAVIRGITGGDVYTTGAGVSETGGYVAGEYLPLVKIAGVPEEVQFQEFRIISYAKNGGVPVEPEGVLELEVGDKCRVKVGFSHKGPKYSSVIHAALWFKGLIDPHDEKLFKEASVTIPVSEDWVDYFYDMDISITSAVRPGEEYGLYAKIDTITPAAISPYYANVIRIAGVPVAGEFRNLRIISYSRSVAPPKLEEAAYPPGVLDLQVGNTCYVAFAFDYRGPKVTKPVRVAIGKLVGGWPGFDEGLFAEANLVIMESTDWAVRAGILPIYIKDINPELATDLYLKIAGEISPFYEHVIRIAGAPVEEFSDLKIFDYTKVVKRGDICKVRNSFWYVGPSTSRILHSALWVWSWFDPHNEAAIAEMKIDMPSTPTKKQYFVDLDIPTRSGMDLRKYGLYSKIDVVIPELISPYYEDVVELVEEVPVGISFNVGVAGTPAGWAGYDRWMCAYFDPGINKFVGDQQWHMITEYVTFSGVRSGGYLAAWVLRTSEPSVCSPQYNSGAFYSFDGRKYLFNIVEGVVYEVA